MDAITENQLGVIQQITGQVLVRSGDGSEHLLKTGDVIRTGDVLISLGGEALLTLSNGWVTALEVSETLDFGNEDLIAGLGLGSESEQLVNTVVELDSPAAGEQNTDEPPEAGAPDNSGTGQATNINPDIREVTVEFGFDTSLQRREDIELSENVVIRGEDSLPTISNVAVNNAGDRAEEGIQDLIYTVTLSNPSASAVSFALTLGAGTFGDAAEPSDYSLLSFTQGVQYNASTGDVTVPAGVTRFEVIVDTIHDLIDEANETVELTVGGQSATGIIVDNDETPEVSIKTEDGETTEGVVNDYVIFKVSHTGSTSSESVNVTLNFANPGSSSDAQLSDLTSLQYNNGTGWQSFTNGQAVSFNGQSSFYLRGMATDDTLFEIPEGFVAEISSPTGNLVLSQGNTTATAQVKSDDIAKNLAIDMDDNETPVFNLLLSLDVSGSMNWTSVQDQSKTGLEIALEALNSLIKSYQGLGEVNVMLTTFNGSIKTTEYFTNEENPDTYLTNALGVGGWTNYNAALNGVESGFQEMLYHKGVNGAANNIVYFISDGDPNTGNGPNTDNAPNKDTWESFLQNYNIERSYAVGIETIGSNYQGDALDVVAYPVASIKLTGNANLEDTLLSTLPSSISNLVEESVGMVSAGSVSVNSITGRFSLENEPAPVGNTTYTFGSSQSLTFILWSATNIALGLLTVKANGDVNFQPSDINSTTDLVGTFSYDLIDSNNSVSNTAQVGITISDTGVTPGFVFQNGGNNDLVVDATNGVNTVMGGVGNDLLDGRDNVDHLYGGSGNDMLYGGSGDDELFGGDGRDMLVGGQGGDTLEGGVGNDLLIGGMGDDILTGGTGSDTFRFSLADLVDDDLLTNGSYIQTDQILDFSLDVSDTSKDILDFSDLLISSTELTQAHS